MATPGERLREIRQSLGLSMEGFGEPLDMSRPTVSNWESGKTDIPKASAIAIQMIYGVRWEWLLKGEEPKRAQNPPRNAHSIPMLDGLPSCGPSGEIGELGPQAEEMIFSAAFIQNVLRQCGAGSVDTLFVARVQGDSMSPTIQAGDTVMVNTALALRLEPRKGALHLVRRIPGSSEARVKRLFLSNDQAHLTMASDNPAYPPITVPIDGVPLQEVVVGRVCWYGRTLVDQLAKPEDW